MDPEKLMDEIRSLNQRLDSMTKTLSTLDQKIDNIAISQRIGDETMRKSANSITIIIRLLAVCIIFYYKIVFAIINV